MDAYWKKADKTIAGKVKANWQVIEKLIADHPYAINWGPVRPSGPRMAGLHPDSAKPKPRAKRVNDLDQN